LKITENKEKKTKEQSKKKKVKKVKLKVPKSVQDTIPYERVYKNGVIEIEENRFSKCYKIEDANFKVATDDEQETIFILYGELLNSFSSDISFEVTINNRNIDENDFAETVLCSMRGDGLDEHREEYNKILANKMKEGKNNLVHEKYITVTLEAVDIEDASQQFASLEVDMDQTIKKINGSGIKALTLSERLSILYDLYHLDKKENFAGDYEYDIVELAKQGLTSKDAIAPQGIVFYPNYFKIGETYGQTLQIEKIGSFLSTDFLPGIYNTSCNMLTSVHYNSMEYSDASKMMRTLLTNINANIMKAQQNAAQKGYSADMIPMKLQEQKDEAQKLLNDMTQRNQKIILTTALFTVFGSSLEELERNVQLIKIVAGKYMVDLTIPTYMQEYSFASSLPLGNNKMHRRNRRILNTEAACVFLPFETKELSHKHGFYYGTNIVSKNMVIVDRSKNENANGIILGTSGSGKSFAAKREILNILLNTNDEVYIIDPEGEYSPLVRLLGGSVARLAVGSTTHINPFDMDIRYGETEDSEDDQDENKEKKNDNPITLKSDFICALCDTVIGKRAGISEKEKSIIDRCVVEMYKPYMEKMEYLKAEGLTIDNSLSPTFRDFYDILLAQPEPEARDIALGIEIYAKGTLDLFSKRTNVDIKDKRLVAFNIKDIGSGMVEMGMQITIDYIWNKMIENRDKGKRTWFYIDEFYLLLMKEKSAEFLMKIWKRARKWNGIPTGITQNVSDLFASLSGQNILSNSAFVMMLKQSPQDRQNLAEHYHIGSSQLPFITNSPPGQGLIYSSNTIVPFMDIFPTDTELFKVLTSTKKID